MARRIATTRTTRLAGSLGVALVGALIGLGAGAGAKRAAGGGAAVEGLPGRRQRATADQSPLPNVAAALAQRKTLRILAYGRGARPRRRARRRLHRS